MEAHISHTYTSYVLDPQVYGLDGSIWKTVSGTPTVTSNKYRLNAAEIITYSQFRFGEIEFNVTVPAAPTASDNRRLGLSGKALGNRGIIAFEFVTAGELRARVRDKFGNSLFNELIPWQAGWTNTATFFRIGWTRNSVVFSVSLTDGTTPWTTTYIAGTNPLSLPMGVDALNANADNMDITSVVVFHSNASLPLNSGSSLTSIVPGTGATNLGKAEDAATASGDTGVAILSRRRDTPQASAGTEGDYQFVDGTGNGGLWTELASLISGENQTNLLMHTGPKFVNSSTAKPTSTTNLSFTTATISSNPVLLVGARVINTVASPRYLFLNNATSIAGAAAPSVAPILIPASGERVLTPEELGKLGEMFTTALTIGNSSTAATFTAGSAGDLLVTIYTTTATS